MSKLLANDNYLRFRMAFPTMLYYADMASDIRQLVLFVQKQKRTYFALNALGMLLAAFIDFVKHRMDKRIEMFDEDSITVRHIPAGLPVVGPGLSMLNAFLVRRRLPQKANRENLDQSACRLRWLKQERRLVERTAFFESVVEGAISLAVQGFALAYEPEEVFGFWDRLSLLSSLFISSFTLSLVLAELDSNERTMETAMVKVPQTQMQGRGDEEEGEHEETGSNESEFQEDKTEVDVPLICGNLSWKRKLWLIPFRYVEIAGRMGPIIMFAVAVRMKIGAEDNDSVSVKAWLLTAAVIMVLALADFVLAVASIPRTVRTSNALHLAAINVCVNYVAHASPLMYPATLPIIGPSKVRFYTLRAVQNLLLSLAVLGYFGHLDGSAGAPLWTLSLKSDGSNLQGVMASAAVCSAVLTTLAPILAWACCPSTIPERTRKIFFSLLGMQGQPFPRVDNDTHRAAFVLFKLLPDVSKEEEDKEEEDEDPHSEAEDASIANCVIAVPDRSGLPILRGSDGTRPVRCYDTFKPLEGLTLQARGALQELVIDRVRENRLTKETVEFLKELRNLRICRITGSRWMEPAWKLLSEEVFPFWENLETLELAAGESEVHDTLTEDNFAAAVQASAVLKSMRRLAITKCVRVKSASLWRVLIARVVPQLRNLEELDLHECLSDALLMDLGADFVAHLPSRIQHLNLDSRGLSRNARSLAATGIPEACMSETMDTHEVEDLLKDVENETFRASYAGLKALQGLRVFRAKNKNFTEQNWGKLIQDLLPLYEEIEELDLKGNERISAESWRYLSHEVFPRYTCLKSLDLSTCKVDTQEVLDASSGLRTLGRLEKLFMNGNVDIKPTGWAEMTKVFHCYPNLVELHLKDCALDDDCVVEIGSGLRRLTRLEKLLLAGNSMISPTGWSHLSKALESLQGLVFLDLSRCALEGQNLEALAFGLGNLNSLRVLDISWNRHLGETQSRQASRVGYLSLKDELEKLQSLQLLNISGNHRQAHEVLSALQSETLEVRFITR